MPAALFLFILLAYPHDVLNFHTTIHLIRTIQTSLSPDRSPSLQLLNLLLPNHASINVGWCSWGGGPLNVLIFHLDDTEKLVVHGRQFESVPLHCWWGAAEWRNYSRFITSPVVLEFVSRHSFTQTPEGNTISLDPRSILQPVQFITELPKYRSLIKKIGIVHIRLLALLMSDDKMIQDR